MIQDDPKRPYKAYAAAAASVIAPILAYWIADTDPFTLKEFGQAVLIAAGSAGLTGGAAYQTRNPKKP